MLAQHGPVPEISITFDPATRCYGFSTRLPGMRPHWMIDTFTSLEDVMRWVDPWRERMWEEPGEVDDSRILVSRSEKPWAEFGRRLVAVRETRRIGLTERLGLTGRIAGGKGCYRQ